MNKLILKDYDEKIGPALSKLGAPGLVFDTVIEEWVAHRKEEPDDDPEEMSLEVELFPTRFGDIALVLEPEAGEMLVTVKAYQEDGSCLELHEPLDADVWVGVYPVDALKSGPKTPANAKCTCGSGKKFKKCCGAVVKREAEVTGAELGQEGVGKVEEKEPLTVENSGTVAKP